MTPTRPPMTQLRKGALELAILSLLEREELYGAALVERLGNYPSLAAPAGTVYPLLSRLTSNNIVQTRWEESPKGPPRKYYSLSDAGTDALRHLQGDFHTLTRDVAALIGEDKQ